MVVSMYTDCGTRYILTRGSRSYTPSFRRRRGGNPMIHGIGLNSWSRRSACTIQAGWKPAPQAEPSPKFVLVELAEGRAAIEAEGHEQLIGGPGSVWSVVR